MIELPPVSHRRCGGVDILVRHRSVSRRRRRYLNGFRGVAGGNVVIPPCIRGMKKKTKEDQRRKITPPGNTSRTFKTKNFSKRFGSSEIQPHSTNFSTTLSPPQNPTCNALKTILWITPTETCRAQRIYSDFSARQNIFLLSSDEKSSGEIGKGS